MLKLSRLVLRCSRGSLAQKSLPTGAPRGSKLSCGIATQAGVSTGLSNLNTHAGLSTALPKFGSDVKVFASYSIFKGKAALSADPLLPKFTKLDSGDYRIERSGVIMLTLWPAIGERKYDWDRRQKFALSVTEVGSLISLGSKDSCEFFHDPSMKSSNAGQVRKSLSIKAHDDGSGYFLSLSVANNILKTNDRLSVPITTAEFAVMQAAFTFALPHIMGWDQYTSQLTVSGSQSSSRLAPAIPSSEWDK